MGPKFAPRSSDVLPEVARSKRPVREALKRESLDQLEEELSSLRVAYERYFLGIDKKTPGRQHDKLDRKLRQMTSTRMGSTALRFRLEALRGRYVTYRQYWTRTCRQIDEGSYVRVVAEADRRRRLAAFEARAARDSKAAREALAADAGPEEAEASAGKRLVPPPVATGDAEKRRPNPGRASAEAAVSGRVPPSPPALEIDPRETRELFRQYVSAKRAAGESTRGISYAAMSKQIARDLPKLRERHGAGVRLEVAKVGNRVTLRARLGQKSGS